MFWPERWTIDGPSIAKARGQEFRLHKDGWVAFNYGPGNCIGRTLAMNKMRAVLAALVRRFDMQLVPVFKPGNWEQKLVDGYVLGCGALPVIMSARS
jgi:cytochrome P450